MPVELDLTRLKVPVKKRDNCTVIDVSSGAFPRYIEVRMPGKDGARRTALWDGLLNLSNSDKVMCEEYPGNPVLRIVGFGGDQDAQATTIWTRTGTEIDPTNDADTVAIYDETPTARIVLDPATAILPASLKMFSATGEERLELRGYTLATQPIVKFTKGGLNTTQLLFTVDIPGTDPSLTWESSNDRFQWNKGHEITAGDLLIPDDLVHYGDPDTLRSFTDDAIEDQAGGVVMLRLTEAAQDLVELGDVAGTGDVDINFNNGVLVIDGLTDDVTLTGGDGISNQVWSAKEHDFELFDTADALGITSHFRDNAATYPAGWTEADAASLTNTSARYSYWMLLGSSSVNTWDYRRQTSVDLENLAANARITVIIGPLRWRDAAFTADISYYFGVYRNSAGIDTATYNRIRLRWDSAASLWKIRGEESDGSTVHNGTEYTLDNAPLNQPFYVALSLNNNAAKTVQNWWGKMNDFALHTLLQQQNPTSAPTWGQFWVRFHMSRGTGSSDRILIGGIDRQDG